MRPFLLPAVLSCLLQWPAVAQEDFSKMDSDDYEKMVKKKREESTYQVRGYAQATEVKPRQDGSDAYITCFSGLDLTTCSTRPEPAKEVDPTDAWSSPTPIGEGQFDWATFHWQASLPAGSKYCMECCNNMVT